LNCSSTHPLVSGVSALTIVGVRLVLHLVSLLLQEILHLNVPHQGCVIVVVDCDADSTRGWVHASVEVIRQEVPDTAIIAVFLIFLSLDRSHSG
jgi:hypothetical protein